MTLLLLALGAGLAHAGSAQMYDRAISLVRHRYLGIEHLDAEEAFAEAAESAEDVVPWLIVDAEGGVATLRHGQRGTLAVVSMVDSSVSGGPAGLDALPGALSRLEAAIVGAGDPIPGAVDLPVALLRGVSRGLDRHSVVLSRSRLERFDERIKGKLTGIGARMGKRDGRLVIKEVFAGGPAALGGLQAGDRITRVDGVSTVGMSTSLAIDRVRGPAETQVVLDIERPADGGGFEALELVLTRAEVVIPTVHTELLASGAGLIRIDNFSEQTTRLVREGLAGFQAADLPITGIVLDLRGNTGGSLLQACKVTDLFVEEGTILRTEGREGKAVENLLRQYRAHPEGIEPDVPMVVLLDHRSASASEIVAGALSLLGRAALVGESTHGKGTVQKLYTLRGGGAEDRVRFKVTVARYRLAGDVPIETGIGLAPDLRVAEARFTRGGVTLPVGGPGPDLLWVDEQPGWREGVDLPATPDFALAVSEEALGRADGAGRDAVLAALEATSARRAVIEDARLVDVFRHRGLDWRPADESGPAPQVDVELSIVDPPVPGSDVEVRALVHNRGSAPLYRVAVQIETSTRLPWEGLTLPVGFLPPGETGLGSAMVRVGAGLSEREDEVGVRVLADQRIALEAEPGVLHIAPAVPAPVAATARIVPEPQGARLEIQLENLGGRHLDHLRARVLLPADAPLELVDPEGVVPLLAAGATERVDLGVRRLAPGETDLELRVEDGAGRRVFKQQLTLPEDGSMVRVSPPVVAARVPRSAPTGQAQLDIEANDDGALRSVTVWMAGDKVAWIPLERSQARVSVPLDVPAGTHAVTVDVVDAGGARSRKVAYVRGIDPTTAGASDP
ncbi:MAG: S41 family peptidase [Myxococcota bacterium]|nr:S41 family peptidase [Myxococcota bacterium]